MRIIPQSVELIQMSPDPLFLIERAARECYKSEKRMDCNCGDGHCPLCIERASKFIRSIIKRGHESVIEHASATFLIVTDRAIANELVRHRIASYSQESTRYCSYGTSEGIAFIQPDLEGRALEAWKNQMESVERTYNFLLSEGYAPQWARSVLPLCLKTGIVTTANFREWRLMLRLRLRNEGAHPQIRRLFSMILRDLKQAVPVIFEDFEEIS